MNSRLTPSEPFPEDLTPLELSEVEVLNSRIQREMAHEYVHDGEVDPETGQRNEELTEELDRRDDADAARASTSTADAAQL
ncbi:hypothetical protein [Arthrobacter burdickii]|uniref:Uncharacterized protein n=1 Tax=Arthrobacter burdickii TaxID=3035920 RepID=A0ABT8K0H0_9MICC|nr:hypothetical protein [Arthrobacter burdickii]MDN4610321.1 hypothetical protein [Arthrobacter burdickii]